MKTEVFELAGDFGRREMEIEKAKLAKAAVIAARTTNAATPEHVAQAAGQFLAIVATFIQPK